MKQSTFTFLLLSLLSIFFIVDCITSSSVKRFKSAQYKGVKDSLVKINLFGTRINSDNGSQKNGLFKLSDRGQAEFIKSMRKNYSDSGSFVNSLTDLVNNGGPVTDYVNVDLKMIFTITKREHYENFGQRNSTFSPADRIEHLSFKLQLNPDSPLKFTRWNKFSTEYDTIDIAEMSFSKSFEQGGSVGGGMSGITANISANAKQSSEEKQNIHHRYIQLNGNISDSKIEVEEEGVRDIDLAGNVIADVSIKFKNKTRIRVVNTPDSITKYSNDSELQNINMIFTVVDVPYFDGKFPDSITANLSMNYIYRNVISGFKTFYEWDDKVNYYSGKDSIPVTLLRKEDYVPPFFYISLNSSENLLSIRELSLNQNYILFFREFWKARDFIKFLKNLSSKELFKCGIYKDNIVKDSIIIADKKYLVMIGNDNSNWSLLTKEMAKTSDFSVLEMSRLSKL